ncbi:MAG: hypothetical protein ACYTE3_18120 [Planctomycetota bacterium]|jgi:hypothetical protein
MARNRGKKALYEVMSKARARQGYGKTLESMSSTKTEEVKPASPAPAPKAKPSVQPSKAVADWWKKPRIAQFNAGRFEFSVPYQVAIALGLVLVVLVLGSYRLGQNSAIPAPVAPEEPGAEAGKIDDEASAGQATAGVEKPVIEADGVPPADGTTPADVKPPKTEEQIEPVKPKGKNAIVLAHSGRVVDLEPVVAHFAEYEIALKIVPLENGQYQLRTVEQFESDPAEPGTAGFKLKSRIVRIGPSYKGRAPAGLDTFAPHYFTDAYGDNVED